MTYWMTLQICKEEGKNLVHIGETLGALRDKSNDHTEAPKDMDAKQETVIHHQDSQKAIGMSWFLFKVYRSQQSSPQRQIFGALFQDDKCDILRNQRGEWGMNFLPE